MLDFVELPHNERIALNAWDSTFFPFQRDWVEDRRKFAVKVKARQIGGSHDSAGWAALGAVFLGQPCTMVSIREPEAIDLLSKARTHCELLADYGSRWAEIVSPPNKLEFTLRSGARVRSTTSSAAGRGTTGNVVLDEFAYHEHPDQVWDSAIAATTHGYSARVVSTPNGVGDVFHDLCTNIASKNPKKLTDWKLYSVTIHEAIAAGMKLDLDACWSAAKGDPRIFGQLYECSFLDSALQFIPHEMIVSSSTGLIPDGDCFAGLDIGANRDRTTLLILQGKNKKYGVKHSESYAKTDDVLLQKLIRESFGVWGAKRLAIDATGMGTFPAMAARREFVHVEPVMFSEKTKEAMATKLYQTLANGSLTLPKASPGNRLHADIAAIRRTITSAGNPRFDAARNQHGHADLAWALMLALQATEHGVPEGAYSAISNLWS